MKKVNLGPDCIFSPQPMYLIGTKNENGTPNFCIITWIGFSFDQTPHLMMTIGGSKQTKTNILREKKFSAGMITEDVLWLADYFGSTKGNGQQKKELDYSVIWGKDVDVPMVEAIHWSYECEVDRVIELNKAHLFLAEIKNIQLDQDFADMDMQMIDLKRLKPAIYAPYHYYAIGEKLGNMGEWQDKI